MKNTAKKMAQDYPDLVHVAVYDLQKVLSLPEGECLSFYYRSRLNCLNFTVTNIANMTTRCFFWNETQGKRGTEEIGSCVLTYLEGLAERATEPINIIFLSDNCGGQIKNQYVASMYVLALQKYPMLHSIEHQFLEVGHTQTEADSVHSVIEKKIRRAKKSGPIFIPQQYIDLIRDANESYQIDALDYNFFKNLKDLPDIFHFNFKRIKISQAKSFKFIKPNLTIHVRYDLDKPYEIVDLRTIRNRAIPISVAVELQNTNNKPLNLAPNKLADLKYFVEKNLIPAQFKDFYLNLS